MKLRCSIIGVAVSIAALACGSLAMADQRANFVFGPITFQDIDPCTGSLHEITIFLDIYEHQEHPNNFLAQVVRTGYTDSGYEMFSGNEIFRINKNVVISKFKDMWRNDDGRMFEVSGQFILNFRQNEVKFDGGTFRCIGGETVLP